MIIFGHVIKRKARLVARGDLQEVDIDENLYSTTAKLSILRLILCIAINKNLVVHQMDITSAFLQAPISEDIFVYPPKGFPISKGCEGKVWKLNKALYGLRSAPKSWYDHLSSSLKSIGWTNSIYEPCVFMNRVHFTCLCR